jgi:hypothetical protein
MIPLYELSSTMVPAQFFGARNSTRINNRLDYEDGGIGINDPSAGLLYQTWWGWIEMDGVYLSAANQKEAINIYESNKLITEISFTFDQNCRPCLAFVEENIPKLIWWDTSVEAQVITTLDTGIVNPRVAMDDKRDKSLSTNDIILAYLRNSNLYYRQQRDRFEVEYLLKTGAGPRLNKIGMGTGLRFQFQVCKA